MKKFWKYLAPVLALCSFTAVSCDDKNLDFDADEYEATSAYAYYFGKDENSGCDIYGLSLFIGDVDEEYRLSSRGIELFVELNAPSGDVIGLIPGEYRALRSTTAEPSFTFNTGSISAGAVYGSYVGMKKSDLEEMEYYLVMDGTVEIRTRNGKFYITADVRADGDDIEFSYSGGVAVIDASSSGDGEGGDSDGDIPSNTDYTFNDFTQGELDYNGAEDGFSYWSIYLGDDAVDLADLSGTGRIACIDLCTTNSSSTDIPVGTYTVSETDGNFVAIPIYEYDGYYYGTMFCEGDNILVGATSGTVKVLKSGSTYTVSMDLVDSDYNNTFKGSYTGTLTYMDYSGASARKQPARSRVSVETPARVRTHAHGR